MSAKVVIFFFVNDRWEKKFQRVNIALLSVIRYRFYAKKAFIISAVKQFTDVIHYYFPLAMIFIRIEIICRNVISCTEPSGNYYS